MIAIDAVNPLYATGSGQTIAACGGIYIYLYENSSVIRFFTPRSMSSPVETSRLAELVLAFIEAGHAQRIVGRDICAKHL